MMMVVNLRTEDRSGLFYLPSAVFCPGFQKGRAPSEKGTFSAVSGPSKGHN